MHATATAEQRRRPESREWQPMTSAKRSRPILLLTCDLNGDFETPFVGRWSPEHSCWVNCSLPVVQPVYPEFWASLPATEKDAT